MNNFACTVGYSDILTIIYFTLRVKFSHGCWIWFRVFSKSYSAKNCKLAILKRWNIFMNIFISLE